jgi:protein-disulfide isomerase
MKTFAIALTCALAVPGCSRDDSAVSEKLDRIATRLDSIEKNLAAAPARGAQNAAAGGQRAQRPRPRPELTYSVPVDDSPIRGRKDALVTIVEAFEFACPYCEQSRGLVDQVLEKYPNDVRVAYKHYLIHPNVATTPALAACAADEQGKYEVMEPLIWDKGYKANRNLGADNMLALAKEAGLDLARFKADMEGKACAEKVRRDQSELSQIGVGSTPSFFVNGRHVAKRSPEALQALIDEELKKARERVAKGTRQADYYKEWVVAKGEKKL